MDDELSEIENKLRVRILEDGLKYHLSEKHFDGLRKKHISVKNFNALLKEYGCAQ
jgi:hypothetical protein